MKLNPHDFEFVGHLCSVLGFGFAKQHMKSVKKKNSRIGRIVVSKASKPVQQMSVHNFANAVLVHRMPD